VREGVRQLPLKARPSLQLLLLDDVFNVSNQDESRSLAIVTELLDLDLDGHFIDRLGLSRYSFIRWSFTFRLFWSQFVNATSCPTFHDNFLKADRLFGRAFGLYSG